MHEATVLGILALLVLLLLSFLYFSQKAAKPVADMIEQVRDMQSDVELATIKSSAIDEKITENAKKLNMISKQLNENDMALDILEAKKGR